MSIGELLKEVKGAKERREKDIELIKEHASKVVSSKDLEGAFDGGQLGNYHAVTGVLLRIISASQPAISEHEAGLLIAATNEFGKKGTGLDVELGGMITKLYENGLVGQAMSSSEINRTR